MAIRGCVYLSAASGENFVISPILDMLKAPTDLEVTFKAAPYVNATSSVLVVNNNNISVDLTGSGTVGTLEWDSTFDTDPYSWHSAKVKITGASSDTQIKIGNLDSGIATSAVYIDDIIIKR